MKKILFLLFIFPSIVLGQTPGRLNYKSIIQSYNGDSSVTSFSGDSVKHHTNKLFNIFDKPVKVNKDTLASLADVRTISASGGLTPTNGFLYWNATTKTYEPYSSYTADKLYLGTTNPTGTIRFNLDGHLATRNFTAFGIGTDVAGTFLTVNGYALNVGTTGTGTVAVLEQGGSTGNGSSILSLKRTISGTGLATSNFINIVDNPSTSGIISGEILSATIGATERISLNPRATSTTVPYILASHNKVTGNLFELKQQDRTKLSLDSAGNVNIPAGTSYKVNGVAMTPSLGNTFTGQFDISTHFETSYKKYSLNTALTPTVTASPLENAICRIVIDAGASASLVTTNIGSPRVGSDTFTAGKLNEIYIYVYPDGTDGALVVSHLITVLN